MSGKSRKSDGAAVADYALVLAQERLVLEAQVAIQQLLRQAGLKQSDLATLLDVSEARVSKMFSDDAKNLTLRTLARIYHVLGKRCRIVDDAELHATPVKAVEPAIVTEEEAPSSISEAVPIAETRTLSRASTNGIADAWLLDGLDVLDMLSEDAPFASSMVWTTNQRIVPANENHPGEPLHGRRGTADARRWAEPQDRYAFG